MNQTLSDLSTKITSVEQTNQVPIEKQNSGSSLDTIGNDIITNPYSDIEQKYKTAGNSTRMLNIEEISETPELTTNQMSYLSKNATEVKTNTETSQRSKKPKKPFGESLDKKSEKIVEQLVIYLLTHNKNVEEFFNDVTFRRTVKGQSYDTVEADDFFLTLHESGIISKNRHNKDLRNYLAVNQENSEVLLLHKIQSTAEMMSENENVKEAARQLAIKNTNKKKKKPTKTKKSKKTKAAKNNKGEE